MHQSPAEKGERLGGVMLFSTKFQKKDHLKDQCHIEHVVVNGIFMVKKDGILWHFHIILTHHVI